MHSFFSYVKYREMQWKEDYAAALRESTGPVGETKLVNRNKSKLQVPRG